MKPLWKKMTIIACCILCAGVVLSGIGWALGGEIVTLEGSLPDHSAATVQRVLGRLEDAIQIDALDWVDDEVQDSLQQAREDVENAMQRADDAVQKTMNISGTVLPLTLSDEQSQPLSVDIVRYLDGIYGHGDNTVGRFVETYVAVADFSGEGVFHLFGGSECARLTELILFRIREYTLVGGLLKLWGVKSA